MTQQDLKAALADLSEVRSDGEPIVSLYLDAHWSDEKQRERARLYVRDAIRVAVDHHKAHPQLEALRRTLDRVASEVALHVEQADEAPPHQGLAVFACEALGLWRVLLAPLPFRSELREDGRPHLLQLARLADDAEPAIIALVQDHGAQIYEVALGAIVNEATVERPVPRRHGEGGRVQGGASSRVERERKSERHVEEIIGRVRREAAERLRQVWERDPRANLVLVGTSGKVAAFERELPERMREKVVARLPRPPEHASQGEVRAELLGRAVRLVLAHERAAEAAQVEHAIGEALRGGLAVLGAADVVLAVNERRVHRLILEEDFEKSGWRCRNCQALGMTHDEVCSFCQGPLARVDSLGEELIGRTLAEDGEIEVVAHNHRLHAYHGVAALLRQAHASGLSGRA
jgi:peptide subunit release factor 1 (eRF1)